jgi:hypothetical protein
MGQARRAAIRRQQAAAAATANQQATTASAAHQSYQVSVAAQVDNLLPKALEALRAAGWRNSEMIKVGLFRRKDAAWPVAWIETSRGTDTGVQRGFAPELWMLDDGSFVKAGTTSRRPFLWHLQNPEGPGHQKGRYPYPRPFNRVPEVLQAIIAHPTTLPEPRWTYNP